MRLLIITQTVDSADPILGFFHRWLVEFARRADALTVIANRVGEHRLPANVKVFSLGKERGAGRIVRYARFFRLALRAMRQADAVFVHMIPSWVLLLYPFAFIFRKPIYLWYTHKSVTLSLRLATWCVKKVFTASEESFRIATPKKIVIGHGIDTMHFTPGKYIHDPQRLKLLAIGRMTPAKDFRFIVDVLDIVRTLVPQRVTLTIVGAPATAGDKKYAEDLRVYIAQKGLGVFIDFVGTKRYDELPRIYQSHDVFLHASETGSIDKVVIEAMACGMPVATTSEAFRKMLPPAYAASRKDAALVAEMIATLRDGKRDLALREIVLQTHNITNVITRMTEIMNPVRDNLI